jgi:hypothetical protein
LASSTLSVASCSARAGRRRPPRPHTPSAPCRRRRATSSGYTETRRECVPRRREAPRRRTTPTRTAAPRGRGREPRADRRSRAGVEPESTEAGVPFAVRLRAFFLVLRDRSGSMPVVKPAAAGTRDERAHRYVQVSSCVVSQPSSMVAAHRPIMMRNSRHGSHRCPSLRGWSTTDQGVSIKARPFRRSGCTSACSSSRCACHRDLVVDSPRRRGTSSCSPI